MNITLLIAAAFLLQQVHPVAEMERVVERGIREGAYPGAVVVVGTVDTVLFARGYGHLTWAADAPTPSPDSTLYDLASLTKVVATTPALMRLADRGVLSLDDPVRRYLTDFQGDGKEAVTIRHLLSHTSGLRAFLPLNTLTETAAAARGRVMEEPLRRRPGAVAEYSDLNAMLMGWVIEAATGMSLDSVVAREVTQPLGMRDTRYKLPRSLHARAAPINRWRGHPIRGVVHDQNAERLNGIAGHAGLYSTGRDLARYAMMYLARGRAGDAVYVRPEIVAEFTARRAGNRALGWEVNDTTSTDNTGTRLSALAFGHGGYTGTSIWIDPGTNVFVILLTNRTFAPRTPRSITRLKAVRADLADAAVRLKEHICRVVTPRRSGC